MQPGDLDQLENLVIYFEFDSSEIRSDFNSMLAAHGRYLAADSSLVIRLEGHADERGSREYNIGLGERRAQAVRQILMLQGASASQLTTISYGEERPAVFGSDDEAYSLNRRVELVYP
jgi:peptidoglycan-associated lipoprotein